MKTTSLPVVIIITAVNLGFASSPMEEHLNNLYTERDSLLQEIITQWLSGGDVDSAAAKVYRLVDVQVRLQIQDETAMLDVVGKTISEAGLTRVKSKKQLLSSIALAYFRQKGLAVHTRSLLRGRTYRVTWR